MEKTHTLIQPEIFVSPDVDANGSLPEALEERSPKKKSPRFLSSGYFRENRIYILMLIFIALFNVAVKFVPDIEKYGREEEAALEIQQLQTRDEIETREQAIARNITRNQNLQNIAAILTFLFTFMLLSGVAVFIAFVNSRIKKQEMVPRVFSPPIPSWGIADAARIAIIFVFLNYIFFSAEALLAEFFKIQIRDISIKMIFNSIVMDSLSLGFILYFIRGKFNQRLTAAGISLKDFPRGVFMGILGYVGFLPVLLLVIFISYLAGKYFHIEPQNQPMLDLFIGEKRTAVLVILTIFVGIVGPVIEEIFFRGFLYSALKKKFAVPLSMFLTSLIFAALHMNTLGFLPIFALALVLVYMFEATGSLLPSIMIHCFHNCMIIVFLFLSRFFSGS